LGPRWMDDIGDRKRLHNDKFH